MNGEKLTKIVRTASRPALALLLVTGLAACSDDGPAAGAKLFDEKQQFGADTFLNYENASGKGPRIPIGQVVQVECLAVGPVEAAPSAKGKWYKIAGPEPYKNRFAAANTFENGDTSGPLSSQPEVDPNVPLCD